jgi:hypothetical protein
MNFVVYLNIFLSLLFSVQNAMTPDKRFKSVEGPSLGARLETAFRLAQSDGPGQPFWVGYGFKVRHGVAVDLMHEPGTEQQDLGLFARYSPDAREVTSFEVYSLGRTHTFDRQVYWLGQSPNDESLAYLRGLLQSKRGTGMYSRLVEAVSMHEGPEATALLEETAKSDAKSERALAAYWLRERESAERPFDDMPGEVDALVRILRDAGETSARRARAAQALGIMADPRGVRELAKYYPEADSPELRHRILGGAANKVNADSVALYADAAARETDPRLKREAISWLGEKAGNLLALAHEGGEKTSPEEIERERRRLAELNRGPWGQAVPALIDVARTHPSEEVRREAISYLNRADDPRVVAFYKEVLAGGAAEPLAAGSRR